MSAGCKQKGYTEMKCLVLKPFEYTDGMGGALRAVTEAVVDIPDDLVPGLFNEGYVGDPEPMANKDAGASPENKADLVGAQSTAVVDIPDGWGDLPWRQMRKLANQVSGDPIADKASAVAAIADAVAARKAD